MEHKFTDEVKEKLVGLLPFTQSATREYIPKYFREIDIPDEYKPKFELRPMTREESIRCKSLFPNGEKNLQDKFLGDIMRNCIISWKDFYTANGDILEYEKNGDNKMAQKCLEYIPENMLIDLFMEISKMSGLLPIESLGLK